MSAEQLMGLYYGGFSVALGLAIGSFLNVCIARWPEDRSVVRPRSHCPVCNHPVRPRDNIPVLSWLWLRARCRDCGSPIAARYPLVELLTGLVGFLVYRRFLPDPLAVEPAQLGAALLYFSFLCLLIIAAYVDVEHQIIPNQTSSYATPVGLVGVGLLQAAGYEGWMATPLSDALLGALGAAALFGGMSLAAHYVLGRVGLGWGDVKLAIMIGAFLGADPGALTVVLIASISGSIVGLAHLLWTRTRAYLPFGPVLALSAALYVLYGDVLVRALLPGAALRMGLY